MFYHCLTLIVSPQPRVGENPGNEVGQSSGQQASGNDIVLGFNAVLSSPSKQYVNWHTEGLVEERGDRRGEVFFGGMFTVNQTVLLSKCSTLK